MKNTPIFDEALDLIDNIYVSIQQGKHENIFNKIDNLFLIFERLTEVNKGNKNYVLDLNTSLLNVENAMIKKDYFMMADYMYYQIKPIIKSWEAKTNK